MHSGGEVKSLGAMQKIERLIAVTVTYTPEEPDRSLSYMHVSQVFIHLFHTLYSCLWGYVQDTLPPLSVLRLCLIIVVDATVLGFILEIGC